MKQIYIEKQAKDQVHQNFRNTNSEVHSLLIRGRPNSDFLNIFLIQNKGKGPPGDILQPDHPPDGGAGPPDINPVSPDGDRDQKPDRIETSGDQILKNPSEGRSLSLSKGEINFNTEIQRFNKNQNSNFLQTVNFTNMKKQILFLAMFTLALIFAGTKSYGQPVTYVNNMTGAPVCADALPLGCTTEDALHPLPGKTYTYSITVDGSATLAAGTTVLWYVTDTAPVIDGTTGAAPIITPTTDRDGAPGSYVLTASAPYNDATNTSTSIDISWQSFDGLGNEVLLVAYVTAAGCTDNVEVYRIKPSFAFTLDVVALLDGGAQGDEECVSPVESAVYTGGTDLTMNYGENWVFFSVTAANFVNSWKADFSSTSYTGGGTLDPATLQWAYAANAQSTTAADWHTSADPVVAQTTPVGGAVGTAGECIIVRAQIVNASSPAGGILTFGVNGTMFDPAAATGSEYANTTLKDLDEPTAPATACANDVTDEVTYTLTERPVIVTTTPASSTDTTIQDFENKN